MMRKYKRNYLKELWINRPWIFIPDVIRFMRKFPYRRKTCYFWRWLRNCLYCNWQIAWKD